MEVRNTGSIKVNPGSTEVNTGSMKVSTEVNTWSMKVNTGSMKVNMGSMEVNTVSTEVNKGSIDVRNTESTPSPDHWAMRESQARVRSAVRRTMESEYSDDEPELSLASIGQLVVTVRACAREIREICDKPDNKANRTSKSRSEHGRKKKEHRSKVVNATNDHENGSIAGLMEERRRSCTLSDECNQNTSQCTHGRGAWKSEVNKRLSLSVTPRTVNGIQDTTIVQEKHILDKVFGRLNGSKTVWSYRGATAPEAQSSENTTTCKPAIVIRDQFSSYGPPLPGIAPASAEPLPVKNM